MRPFLRMLRPKTATLVGGLLYNMTSDDFTLARKTFCHVKVTAFSGASAASCANGSILLTFQGLMVVFLQICAESCRSSMVVHVVHHRSVAECSNEPSLMCVCVCSFRACVQFPCVAMPYPRMSNQNTLQVSCLQSKTTRK